MDFEERKNYIAKRHAQLQEARQAIEQDVPEMAPEEFEVAELEEGEQGEFLDTFEDYLYGAHEEGYTAYVEGQDLGNNPFGALLDEETDPENIDTAHIIAEAWSEGWMAAHREACIASVVLTARKLVGAQTEAEADAQFSALAESLNVLGETVDFEDLESAWELGE
jgi:hypothetical protein